MEIKFRGQCQMSKEMVFGDLIHGVGAKSGRVYILPNVLNLAYVKHCHHLDGVEVVPETVGQFTGLKDKNGTDVFRGDIFSLNGVSMFVEYVHDRCRYVLTTGKGYDTANCKDLDCDLIFGLEIIGNIHEHPHLLAD